MEELKPIFESWFGKEFPLPAGMERGPIGRDLKSGCEKAFMAGVDTRPSPWVPITPETMPEETGDYWVIRKGVARPEIRTFDISYQLLIGVFPTDPKITYYMPIPPLPERQ